MNTNSKALNGFLAKPWLPYVLPFIIFLLLTEPARFYPALSPYFYCTKTIIVGFLLWSLRHQYAADFSLNLPSREIIKSILCGLLVLIIWVGPEQYLFQAGKSAPFVPHAFGNSQAAAIVLIGVRLIGSSLVVPVMEELFWRSFLMRYLINPEFRSIPIGTFTWFSFVGVAIFFGLEHHRILVGVLAGLVYGLLLVHQKNLKGVIVAHGVTNLGLGIYVILTGNWIFW